MTIAVARVAMVRPPIGAVTRGVAPLRATPDDAAELVDEAQYGEVVTCLAEQGEWTYVQGPDLYFGWIRTTAIASVGHRHPVVVAVPLAVVRGAPFDTAARVDELPAGAVLPGDERVGDWWRLGEQRYVRVADTQGTDELPPRYPTADDLLATAASFIGVPYLWGGTSAHGIDCSGFTQQVYRLNGVGLDRDADQQALAGSPVERARPGDLFFFGRDGVTHTAIATGERTFLHAPQSGMRVAPAELTDGLQLRATRRYLL